MADVAVDGVDIFDHVLASVKRGGRRSSLFLGGVVSGDDREAQRPGRGLGGNGLRR